MQPTMDRALRVMERMRADERQGRKRAYPDGLTAREAEVLRLIAAGKTNREIAAALVVSPATVVHHTISIYRKIDARNRTDAAAYAFRLGLVTPPDATASPG